MDSQIKIAYEKYKNLKLAALELGMPWQNLYLKLKKLGVPVTGDKAKYGSDKDKLAARAEQLFREIVPFAESQNDIQWQPLFDFLISGHKIDIKASKENKGSKKFHATRWAFSVHKQEFCADFIVCFAFSNDKQKIFLIPGEIVRHYMTISISTDPRSKSKWLQFEVNEKELKEFFQELGKI